MNDCPTCEYHKQRAKIWRDEAYKLAGHPLPRKETSMTQDEIIEMAIQGHASTRDAIRWAIVQEREACAKECWKQMGLLPTQAWSVNPYEQCIDAIRARGQA